jgi:cyclomaltodextrinase
MSQTTIFCPLRITFALNKNNKITMYCKKNTLLIFAISILLFWGSCTSSSKISSSKKAKDWTSSNIYEVNVRQFSAEGTFKAFETQLPRLKDMGVDIVWLMPIHPIGKLNRKGGMGSHYSVQDYKGVNPDYGTLDDFKHLVKKAHDLGMYVIIDWVANHTACDNVWIAQHPDWYSKDEKGNMKPPVADWADVYDLNYDNADMQNAMIDALKYWIIETNIDGYRCDVAEMVPLDFWKKANTELHKLNKPIFMLAEGESPDLHKSGFDATYGWTLHHILNDVSQKKKTVADLDNYFKEDLAKYGKDAYRMYFTSNHDENSWNGTEFERMGAAVKACGVLAATTPGIFLMYNGQEAALHKRLKFFEKDPIEWSDYSMTLFYQSLLKLKKAHPALYNGAEGGDMTRINTTDDANVLAFYRKKGNDEIVVLINMSADERAINFTKNAPVGAYKHYLSGKENKLEAQSTFILKPWAYSIWTK